MKTLISSSPWAEYLYIPKPKLQNLQGGHPRKIQMTMVFVASRPPRAAAKMPSGCWSLEGVGEMELTCFLVEKAILWSEGKTWMHHFYRYIIHVQMLIISRM